MNGDIVLISVLVSGVVVLNSVVVVSVMKIVECFGFMIWVVLMWMKLSVIWG